MKPDCLVLSAMALVAISSASLWAQEEYPAGTFQLAPRVDLHLQPVPVIVPGAFKGRVRGEPVLNLPPGFQVKVFSAPDTRDRLRMMAFDGNGVLHVANERRVLALPDRDDDGVADEVVVAADGLTWTNSIAFHEGALYVAQTDEIVRYTDVDGDLIYEEQELVATLPSAGWHTSRAIAFDERKGKFYVAMGSPCDLCRIEKPVRGYSNTKVAASDEWDAILEFNLDGSGRRIFATGMRNVVGLDIHPETNELWGVHNHFDLGGTHIPPEWIDIIRDGDFMGYPLAYGYQVWIDPAIGGYDRIAPFTGDDSLTVQRMKRPVALVPAHQAPLGIHFYDHPLFPPEYRGKAFVSIHGGKTDGNLSAVSGFKVIAVLSDADGANARLGDFLTGFATGPQNEVWGKPVGIVSDDKGRLYVSSDSVTRAIFRIEPAALFGVWKETPPDSALSGASIDVAVSVNLRRFLSDIDRPTVTADLTDFGGPADAVLVATGDSTYSLETEKLTLDIPNGRKNLAVAITQGPHTSWLRHTLIVVPTADQPIFTDGLGLDWQVNVRRAEVEPSSANVFSGTASQAVAADFFNIEYLAPAPVDPFGFGFLRLAFHPGDATATKPTFNVRVNGDFDRTVALLGPDSGELAVDLARAEWQVVHIPLSRLSEAPIEKVSVSGNLSGTFYLDELALVRTKEPPPTVVFESRATEIPEVFTLQQNYPNPFNSATVIGFALPTQVTVDLSIYDQAGQKVVTLIDGVRQAGDYSVRWDGRDADGEALSSGVYLYRLRSGGRVETRKLTLVR